MQAVRKLFDWLFGLVSLMCLEVSISHFCAALIRPGGALRLVPYLLFGIMDSMAFVYAMAWWTTWKEKPSARAWGVVASLLHLSAVFWVMHFAGVRMNNTTWSALSLGALALVAYIWPDRADEQTLAGSFGGDDSAP